MSKKSNHNADISNANKGTSGTNIPIIRINSTEVNRRTLIKINNKQNFFP